MRPRRGAMGGIEVDVMAIVSVEFDEPPLYLGVDHVPGERVSVADGPVAGVLGSSCVTAHRCSGHLCMMRLRRGSVVTPTCDGKLADGYTSEHTGVSYVGNRR